MHGTWYWCCGDDDTHTATCLHPSDEQFGDAPVKERRGLLMVTMDDAQQRINITAKGFAEWPSREGDDSTDFAAEHPARPEFIIELKGQDGGTEAFDAVHSEGILMD